MVERGAGSVRELEFTAQPDGQRIQWRNERLSRTMWEAGPELVIAHQGLSR